MTKTNPATEPAGPTDHEIPLFTNSYLPEPPYGRYMKRHLTEAVRIDGPFRVRTPEGELECDDGYLAIDSGGFPYCINRDEFERIYELAEQTGQDTNPVDLDDGWRIRATRDDIVRALLQNPSVERYCYGNPLEPGRRGEYPSPGALLAHLCHRLAEDYVQQTCVIDAQHPSPNTAPDPVA